jgi:zinc transporter
MNDVPRTAPSGLFRHTPDKTGMVFAYHFDADGCLTDDSAQAKWTWRSYLSNDIRARVTIERDSGLPQAVRESMLAPGHACHLDLDRGWLYGDLPDLRHDYAMEARGLTHFRFALNETVLIGGCKQPLRSIDHVRHQVESGSRRFHAPCEVVEAIVGHSLDGLAVDLIKIGEALDEIEERIVRDAWHSERQALNETRRQLVLIHREMASIASLFRHLEHQHHLDLPGPVSDMAARLSNRTLALHHDGEQLQAHARLLQDELMAKLTAQTNQLLFVLSAMTAVLLPMTVISGLFGMNVGGIPFGEHPAGFWIVSIFAAAIAGGVLLLLKRIGSGI